MRQLLLAFVLIASSTSFAIEISETESRATAEWLKLKASLCSSYLNNENRGSVYALKLVLGKHLGRDQYRLGLSEHIIDFVDFWFNEEELAILNQLNQLPVGARGTSLISNNQLFRPYRNGQFTRQDLQLVIYAINDAESLTTVERQIQGTVQSRLEIGPKTFLYQEREVNPRDLPAGAENGLSSPRILNAPVNLPPGYLKFRSWPK